MSRHCIGWHVSQCAKKVLSDSSGLALIRLGRFLVTLFLGNPEYWSSVTDELLGACEVIFRLVHYIVSFVPCYYKFGINTNKPLIFFLQTWTPHAKKCHTLYYFLNYFYPNMSLCIKNIIMDKFVNYYFCLFLDRDVGMYLVYNWSYAGKWKNISW